MTMNYFDIRKLKIKDITKIKDLENSSYESYYVKSSEESLKNNIKNGISYGVFVGNKLVAFSDALFLDDWEHKNWIYGFFIENGHVFNKKTIVFCNTFVHEDYRGNGYQKMLRKKMIEKYKDYRFLTRIAQKNKYSIKNIRSLGFKKLCQERIRGTVVSFYTL